MLSEGERWRVIEGDCLASLRRMDAGSVRCCVTSPPYWGLRDYGHVGQLGLEKTPEEYVAGMVAVFAEVRRVLSDDGTLWLNLGDSYAGSCMTGGNGGHNASSGATGFKMSRQFNRKNETPGLKPKDLVGIPWRVAFALQADGWFLRSDIIWAKPNPMPESVTDRPTKAHEYVFLLAKSERYFYDADAVAEESEGRELFGNKRSKGPCLQRQDNDRRDMTPTETRNRRSVWTVASEPYAEAHFATYPPSLIEPCVLAGSAAGDVVLDPFNGSGTTGVVSLAHGRRYLGLELNPAYVALTEKRLRPIAEAAPLMGDGPRRAREVEQALRVDPRQTSIFDALKVSP